MLLQKQDLRYMNVVAHEGKLVIVATDLNGYLWYTVKQDGFESAYLNGDPTKRTGWEPFSPLEMPFEDDDTSVVAREAATFTREDIPGTYLLKSRYKSKTLGAPAPAQLVSADGHIYVFRQSTDKTVLCDRYVLDGLTNKLGRKLEVRFKRSRKRYEAFNPGKTADVADTLDFRDANGAFFFEPTIELRLVGDLADGWFAVTRVPTAEHEQFRWHIFSYNSISKKIDVVSIRNSDEGLFDIRDQLVFDDPATTGAAPIPRSIPGIIRRTITIPQAVVTGGLAATKYDLQEERQVANSSAKQLVRTTSRVMLAVPTDKGLAAYTFALAADGTLSEMVPTASTTVVRSDERDLMLPLNTLDQIKPVGSVAPPPTGVINAMRLGSGTDSTDGRVIVSSLEAGSLSTGDRVKIRGTKHYNGLYTITRDDDGSFVIEAPFIDNEIGVWERHDAEETGLVFDGMISAHEKTTDGKLRVYAQNHGLVDGDLVQIVGTVGMDGEFPVTDANTETFVIDRKWTAGEAVNVKLLSSKRRGIVLDGQDDCIDLPSDAFPSGQEVTICVWANGGSTLPKDATLLEALDNQNRRVAYICLPAAAGGVYFDCGNGVDGVDRVGGGATATDYKGGWAHWAFTKDAATNTMKIYRNGVLWKSGVGARLIGQVTRLRIGALLDGRPAGVRQYYEGTLADLAIYSKALTPEEIKNSIYVTLTGNEAGLMGYWRMGAVVEAEARTVTDISTHGRNGTVTGGASCGGVSLERKLKDGTTLAVKYTNEELVAVTQRATYIEELDFRIMSAGRPLTKAAVDNTGGGRPVFVFRLWGKRSRNAEDIILLDPQPVTQPFIDLGGGWFRAICRFTIPDGLAMLRSFEIADVRGTWDKLEINRHAIRIISDAITLSTSAEAPVLSTLADGAAAWAAKLKEIAANELIESQKLAQKLETEAKLTLLADAEYLRAERDATAKDVETLTREVADLETQYRNADADPLNHYVLIRIAGTTNQFLHFEASGYMVIWDAPHWFEFVNWGSGRIGLKMRGDNKWVYREYTGRLAHGINATQWMLGAGGSPYFFRDWSDGRFWHREGGTGKMILYTTGQAWEFVLGDACNGNIAAANDAWQFKKKLLAERQARLNELNTLLDPNTPQRPVLEQRLATLSSELGALQTTLATANGVYIDGVKTLQQGALSMPKVGTDRRGLETNAALLGFVMPASRISMLETCEGNVLVSYQDADNRMRLTHYDATADSRNTAFEQWITDAGRVCISQTKTGTAVSLAKAVPMENYWSAEAWVLTPLPTWEWVTLAGTQDQKNAVITILGGTQLGMRSEGVFFASGFRMDSLAQGWHHIAAVKRLDAGNKPVVVFYVDGAAVGSSGSPAFSAVSLNGTSHSVDLQAISIPVSAEITVSFWARAGARVNPAAAAVVLEATDAQAKRILRISIPNSAGRIVWDCGADATNFDSLDCSAQPSDYEGTWTHWVFTKNATTGLMRIYRNGRLWCRGIGRTKPITAATKVTIGKATTGDPLGFRGDIADVCVWNKELSANEILNGMGRPINVDDLRLAGYWKFEGTGDKAKARDYSKAGKDGTLVATPVMLDVPTPSVVNIDRLGIATTTTPPPPPPTPIRGGSPVLFLDCSDDRVELPPAAVPAGNALTFAFWTRAGSNMPRQHAVIEALNTNISASNRVLGVHLPWNPEIVYFDCGLDTAGMDRIEKTITAAEYKGIWTHWAFTKNCTTGEMKIYRNGVLWHSGTGKTKPIPATTKCMLGSMVSTTNQLYHGELTEVSIWNRALSDAEVTNLMGTTLRGDEPGLHGYWNFDASQATDLTAGKRHGTYFGSPVTTPPVPQQASAFFDGTDDHVVVPEMNVDFSQGLSIETWVFYDRYNNVSRILDFGAGTAADNFLLWNVSTSSTLRLSIFRGSTERYLDASSILETGKWIHIAATVDSAGNAKIYKNGVQVASGVIHAPANVSRTKNYFGRSNWAGDPFFSGRMAEVRIWNRVRTQAEIQSLMTLRLSGQEAGLVGYWTFTTANAPDLTASARHGVYTSGARIDVVSAPNLRLAPPLPSTPFTALPPFSLPLKLSEVRLWSTALNDDEIAVNSKTLLSGNEPNLMAYLPMNEAIGSDTRDITGAGFGGTLNATIAIRWACGAPIGNLGSKRDGISAIEYSTVIVDPAAGRKTSIMRRFYGGAANDNLLILPDKRIEELDQVWIGNAQFNPTLLGYIEGAPPVPSENLTEDFSYNGATSVELVVSEELEFRWNQSEDIGAGISLDTFRGLDMDVEANEIAVLTTAAKLRAGVKANLNLGWNWQRETSVATQSTNRLSDRLELRGTPEQTPKFPHLGKRFIPKNVGYALVVSATADVFATRLRRSGKMIGYELVPVDGIPPDVNTITFLMNPAYVMAGSLDGLTGTHPTSDKFHRHVPAMRAQYGSMYPASYYRVKEAYALKQAIENEDKRREAFFAQFSTEDAGFAMNSQIDQGQTTQPIGTNQSGSAAAGTAQNQSISEQTEEVNKRQSMIQSTIGDPSKRAHADASFKAWQRKMERLQVLAGKRNIVNTYVWDADGGLRTETQSFANMAEHTIGGSFSVDGGLGAELQGNLGGPAAELTVLVNGSLTQTASKAQSTNTGVELNVDLSGVEATGITNHDDMPILPGEKVDRYRFMTFYLENSTQNFHDFWGYVVDPEWLRSNGEEARALRQAMGKANKAWRVLHRVTYVERPSLMGFGQDVRSNDDASGDLIKDYLVTLTETQLSLQSQLDEIKTILAAMQTKLNP